MNIKTKIIIGAVVMAGAFFYGGYAYASHGMPARGGAMRFGGSGQNMAMAAGMMSRNGGMGGMVTGSVIAKDDQSITVKLFDGGSKIVFVGASTQVMKSVQGDISDVSVGQSVSVTGSQNQDGSVTARSLDIRPLRMATTSAVQR